MFTMNNISKFKYLIFFIFSLNISSAEVGFDTTYDEFTDEESHQLTILSDDGLSGISIFCETEWFNFLIIADGMNMYGDTAEVKLRFDKEPTITREMDLFRGQSVFTQSPVFIKSFLDGFGSSNKLIVKIGNQDTIMFSGYSGVGKSEVEKFRRAASKNKDCRM